MAVSPEHKTGIDSRMNPPIEPGAATYAPEVFINQTSTAPRSAGGMSGIAIIAIIVALGVLGALYYGMRSDTTAPSIIQNNVAPVAPSATPPAAVTIQPESAVPPTDNVQPGTTSKPGTAAGQ